MTAEKKKVDKDYFAEGQVIKDFTRSFSKHLERIQKTTTARYVNPENVSRLRHGGQWSHPGAPHVEDGQITQHTAFVETKYKDIVDQNLNVIDKTITSFVDQLGREFAKMMYSTISAAAERVGNVVRTKTSGSIENALLDMMEKIEFSADRHGKVSLPQIHVGSEMFAQLKAIEARDDPEFQCRIDEIKKRKTDEALAKEAERKSKFLRYGE